MDCAQHTDTAAVAYCCTCGKALCAVCKRDVQGAIFCEPCLAARIHPGGNFGSADVAPQPPERSPVGALVLIGLGVLFLLSNLGWFSFFWIRHYWPVILIVTGLWLFIRRQRGAR
jgi:hypothetical protein